MARDVKTPTSPDDSPDQSISPSLRRRLHECYERATELMKEAKYDYDYVHQFLSQCVKSDPGNAVYLDAFLDNLQRKYNNNKRGAMLKLGGKGPFKKASAARDWKQVFKLGPEVLKTNPWDVPTLRTMAEACAEHGSSQTELRYLKNALDPNPQDADVNRHCALTLARIGQFDQAIICWTRVDEALQGDEEAQRMISQLQIAKSGLARDDSKSAAPSRGAKQPAGQQPAGQQADGQQADGQQAAGRIFGLGDTPGRKGIELTHRQKLEQAVANNPTDTDSYFELANVHVNEGRLGDAAHVLTKAVSASGGDIRARERLEDIEILRKAEQVTIAEQRAASGEDPQASQLAEQLRSDLNRFEMEVYSARSERYPQDGAVQFEFGRRLKQAENYRMAVPCFHQAIHHPELRQAALLELGECLQRTRQYGPALECYLTAVVSAQEANDVEVEKTARYRSGLLAFGLKNYTTAESHLAALIELDPGYKDAAARLDKIREMRHKE